MFSLPKKNLEQFHIDPGMTVADLGAGVGFYAFYLSNMVGPSGRVYAIDVQKNLLQKLKAEATSLGLSNIDTIWTDLDEPNSTNLMVHSVDRVVVANTLFQIEKKDVFLKEALRILKPKGQLLLIDWSESFGGIGPHANQVITPDMARVLCESAGFIFDKHIKVGDHHYGMIFKKQGSWKIS